MKLDYQIVYSKRKTVSMSVERDASVVVRAPVGMPEEKVCQAVEAKRLWLFEKTNHKQKYTSSKQRKEFVSGETILYLGRNYQLELVDTDLPVVRFDSRFIVSRRNQPHAGRLLRRWYVQRAQERLPRRAAYFADSMGVRFNRILISDLKVRWASCTPAGNLNFNWRVMKAPAMVIDYLIVHELAHLIEPNHTPRFWNVVSIQVPNYDRAKDWLRDNGDALEAEF